MTDIRRKQPHEVIDFDFDAARRMTEDEVVTGATVTYTGPDNALTLRSVQWADTYAKVWIADGTDGTDYKVTGLITTSGGRTLESEFILRVRDL